MPSIEKIKTELEDVRILKGISSALLEIASIRIRGLREEFERNQTFYAEVSELYRDVKLSALHRNYDVDADHFGGKEIHIAITSNKRFYGSLNRTVIDHFNDHIVDASENTYLVIGNTGRHLMEGSDHRKQVEYMSFKDDMPTPTETEVFLERTKQYDKVFLYYPAFTNIFKQDPEMTDITYSTTVDDFENSGEVIEQIYEPELTHILAFFESQVRRLLFTRIMLESEVSRVAARLVKMNSTEERASTAMQEKSSALRREFMIVEDIRLLETFSSAVQWKKHS